MGGTFSPLQSDEEAFGEHCIRNQHHAAMAKVNCFAVVRVRFPFSDEYGFWSDRSPTWRVRGLNNPSLVRSNLFTLHERPVSRTVGLTTPDDQIGMTANLKALLLAQGSTMEAPLIKWAGIENL